MRERGDVPVAEPGAVWRRLLRPFRQRLLVRVYLVSLVLVLLAGGMLNVLRRQVLEPSQQRGTHQLTRLVADLVAERWDEPAGPEAVRHRIGSLVDAELTVFADDGRVLASGGGAAEHGALDEQAKAALYASDEVGWVRPRTAIAPVRLPGGAGEAPRTVGYIKLSPPGPPLFDFEGLLVALALLMVVVTATSVLLARDIARPLSRLTQATRAFGRGDLTRRAELDRDDELGELGRAFDEMAERTAHLVRAQKELLANLSHELRTPLSRLRVALDLAIEGGDQRRMEILTRDVQEELDELHSLLTEILDATRLDLAADRATATPLPLRPAPVAWTDLQEALKARFAVAHPGRVLVADSKLPVDVMGDELLLRRAISNLLDNAARYSEAPSAVRLRAETSGEDVVITVTDEGIGVSEEDQRYLFEPFFRADRSRSGEGTGLGLVLALRIAEAHRGHLILESELGVGTTATLRLPRDGVARSAPSDLPGG